MIGGSLALDRPRGCKPCAAYGAAAQKNSLGRRNRPRISIPAQRLKQKEQPHGNLTELLPVIDKLVWLLATAADIPVTRFASASRCLKRRVGVTVALQE